MRIERTWSHRSGWRRPSIIGWAQLGVVSIFLGQFVLHNTVESGSLPFVATTRNVSHQKLPSEPPATIIIPSIGINATVADAGLKADGTMDIQKNPDQVAWYEFGTRPGDEGSAVIAGHSGWVGLHGSIFNNIYKLQKGDKVLTFDHAGLTKTFIVTGSKEYNPTANASSVFQSSDGKAHLNLVTCDGVWINAVDSDSSRLVVFTDLEQR